MTSGNRTVRVEFYGIPRARTGVSESTVEMDGDSTTVENVLSQLAARFPSLGRDCLDRNELREGFAANVQGERFVRHKEEILRAGETLLIFSADAGG